MTTSASVSHPAASSAASTPARKVVNRAPDNPAVPAQPLIQCRVELPQHIFAQYADQATLQSKDPELVMTERLTQHSHNVGTGLWFNAEQKKRLELCIGHMASDADGALQRLEPISKITVEGQVIRIPPEVLRRLSTRTLRGQTLTALIEQQVIKALKQYVGLLPL